MTQITTDDYWDADGLVLNTPAYNIDSLDGLESIAPRRGTNLLVPYRPGQVFRPKMHDAKLLSMQGWVSYKTVDGVEPVTRELRWGQFHANVAALRLVFGKRYGTITLTRRLRLLDGTLEARTATVEQTGAMPLGFTENEHWPSANFVAEFLMLDPWWKGPLTTLTIPVSGLAATVKGTVDVTAMNIRFNGPLTNPTLTNTSISPSVWVKFGGALLTGEYVDLDTSNFTAIKSDGTNLIGAVSHSGAHPWMQMFPGATNFTLAPTAGTGNAVVTYYPPYL